MDRRQFCVITASTLGLMMVPARAATSIRLRELYNKDMSFSDYALAHENEAVTVSGFMAPPLKADTTFFVLTNRPLAVCPFCETEAEWPADILAVYTKRIFDVVPFNVGIEVSGQLELGTYTDPEFGFLSRVRIQNAEISRT
jgi:hypothetical protein